VVVMTTMKTMKTMRMIMMIMMMIYGDDDKYVNMLRASVAVPPVHAFNKPITMLLHRQRCVLCDV